MTNQAKLKLPALLIAVCVHASACGTLYPDASSVGSPVAPSDVCYKPTKLFGWLSISANSISWTKGKEVNDVGTLALVFTITNNDRLPHALSNSGSGILYGVDFSVIGEDGTAYAATEPSGTLAGNEINTPIEYQRSKDGGVKFKVPRGNYKVVLERKFNGKVAESFACTLVAQ